VTPNGGALAFASIRSLTGYDNGTVRELFVYDAETQQLLCASCNPTGEPAKPGENYPPVPNNNEDGTYQYRWVSADGSRVFFDSSEALVPQDTNGVEDVYEWERNGAGSCRQSPGCIYLISGDLSVGEALFADASESGNDVFFTSRADLVPQDQGENVVLYDARVNGGFPRTASACTGTGCQGVPPAPPTFATPSSVTFNGIGNFPPSPGVKPKSRISGCERNFVKKRGKCVKKRKHGRRKQTKAKKAGQTRSKKTGRKS
jgi:hypothetical protein